MLISQKRIFSSIIETLEALQQRSDVPKDVLLDAQGMATMLRHTEFLEESDGAGIRAHCRRTADLLTAMQSDAAVVQEKNGGTRQTLDSLINECGRLGSSPLQGGKLTQAFIAFLRHMDQQFSHLARVSPQITGPLFSGFTEPLLQLHNSFEMFGTARPASVQPAAPPAAQRDALTEKNLSDYLRHKLSDPGATVVNLTILSGGFGKETSLFRVESKNFNADLVMRRDPAPRFFEGIDCHPIRQEFPLLKAVHERGFPVPEVLWLEESPQIIKGPDYLIVRKTPGQVAGDVTGGQGNVSPGLQRELADVVARLHALPPIRELGEHNPAFSATLWNGTVTSCAQRYISMWYDFNMKTGRLPAPALHGLFNWMLTHLPQSDAHPTLVHGDIGLHNLLFHEGQLSGVLDWEFSHIGDPAEDLGYIRAVMGHQLDWPGFLADYEQAGGKIPGAERIAFYEIWSHVRNAAGSNIVTEHFDNGEFVNARYGLIPYRYVAHYFARAQALIAAWENNNSTGRDS